MSNIMKHLDREFEAMGWATEQPKDGDPDPQVWVYENLKDLLEAFSKQGHSGSSAPYVTRLFSKLAAFEPLGPLTGVDSEWGDVSGISEDPTYQNKRCSHVFKGEDGKAYDIQGKVFREPDGACFTNYESRVPVTFPYTPKTEYVDVPRER